MSRYIIADEYAVYLLEKFKSEVGKAFNKCGEAMIEYIDSSPSADVRENIHGEWIEHEDELGMIDDLMCSLCGHCTYQDYPNFCPNCGADMRGEQNDSN